MLMMSRSYRVPLSIVVEEIVEYESVFKKKRCKGVVCPCLHLGNFEALTLFELDRGSVFR